MIRKLGINQFEYDVEFKGDVRFPEITSTSSSLSTIVIDSTGKLFKSTGSEPDGIGFDGTGDLIIQQPTSDKDIIFIAPGTSDLGDTVTYITIDSSVARILFSQEARFTDNVNLKFGTGGDTMIYHDGSDSYIDHTGTGHLYIRQGNDDSDITFQSDNGSGGLATYYQIDGGSMKNNFFKSLLLTDNVKTLYGTASDLQIYHSGTKSFIQNATGHLDIRNTATNSDIIFQADDGSGSFTEYFRVDGGDERTVFTKHTRHLDNAFFAVGTGGDFTIDHDGSNTSLQNSTGELRIRNYADDQDVVLQTDDGTGGITDYIRLDGSATKTIFSKPIDVGVDPGGHDVRFYGAASGEQMLWDSSESQLVINHDTDDYGLGIFTVSSDQMTQAQLRVGRDEGQYWGVYTRDRDANVIHRQDETSGVMNTNFIQWDSNTSEKTGKWQWQYGDGSGGSIATAMILTQAGQLNLPQNSATIGGTNLGNANLLIGSTSVGIGIDNNEIVSKGDHLYFGAGGSSKSIIFRSGGTSTALTLDSSQNASFTGDISLLDNKILQLGSGSADLQLLHDGSNSHVVNYTGDLKITNNANDKDVIFNCDDGSGGNTAYLTLDGSVGYTTVQKNMRFADNVEVEVGTSGDFYLIHDGTTSKIINDTGDIHIQNNTDDGDIIFRSDDGSGGTTSYFHLDGGMQVVQYSKNLYLTDNIQIRIGSGSDFQILHDGTDTKMHNDTGHLKIEIDADDKDLQVWADDQSGGLAEYFRVDGSLGVNRFIRDVRADDNVKIHAGTSEHGITLVHDGSNSNITNAIGDLTITNFQDDGDIVFKSDDGSGSTTEYFRLDGGAAITGVSREMRFFDNVKLKLGSGPDAEFYHDGSNTYLLNDTGNLDIRCQTNDGDIIFRCDDGSGGNAEYIRLDGSVTTTKFSKNTLYEDNVRAQFGTGADANIRHDGTDTYIGNSTGHLYIQQAADDKDLVFQCDDDSGGLTTYLTLDGGLGFTTVQKTIRFEDNVRSFFGTGADLSIYHDSTNSNIANSTGNLFIDNYADDALTYFRSDDGSGGIATYIEIQGSNTRTVFRKDLNLQDNVNLYLGTSSDLRLVHDSADSAISNATGNLVITNEADDGDIFFKSDNGSGGTATYFYLDGGNTNVRFEKDIFLLDNVNLRIGSGTDLEIYHDGTDNYIRTDSGDLIIQQTTDDKDIIFQSDDQSGGLTTYLTIDGSNGYIRLEDDRRLTIGSGNDLQLRHTSSGTFITNFTNDFNIVQQAADRDITFQCDDGSGDVETYFFLDGSASSGNPITIFPDNSRLMFGNGSDLELFHNGSNSYIRSNTAFDMIIQQGGTDKDILFQADDGSGGTTTYFQLDGSATNILASQTIKIIDDKAVLLGTDGDAFLKHTGSRLSLTNDTGDIVFTQRTDDGDIQFLCDDGSGGTTQYFRLDGGLSYTVAEKTIRFNDNQKAALGSGLDMQLYHNGSHSYIENNTGNIAITNNTDDGDIIFSSDDGSGGTTEYFRLDGSVGGGSTVHTVFPDNSKAVFGAGLDTQIWHDGTNSYIKQQGGGNLIIQQTAADQDIILQSDDGSGGETAYITLDGGNARTNIHKRVRVDDNIQFQLGSDGDIQFSHTGSIGYLYNNTGDFRFRQNADDKDFIFQCDDGSGGVTDYMRIDGSHSRVVFSNNVQAAFGSSSRFVIFHDGTEATMRETVGDLTIQQLADDKDIIFKNDDGSGGTTEYLRIDGDTVTVEVSKPINLASASSSASSGIYAQFINLKGFCTLAANYKFAEDIEDTKSPYEMALDYGSATISSSTEVNQSNLFRSAGFHVPVACSVNAINMQVTCNNAGNVTVAVVEYRPSEAGTDQVDHPRTVYEEVVVASNDNNNKVKTVTVATADLDNTAIPAGSHIMIMAKGDSDSIGGSTFISAAIEIKW